MKGENDHTFYQSPSLFDRNGNPSPNNKKANETLDSLDESMKRGYSGSDAQKAKVRNKLREVFGLYEVSSITETNGPNRQTALHMAANKGDALSITTLLGASADVHIVNSDGNTALHLAAVHGHASAISFLVEARADLQATDKMGETPLKLAQDAGHGEDIKSLLR